jgi:hypothetical protein
MGVILEFLLQLDDDVAFHIITPWLEVIYPSWCRLKSWLFIELKS